jgi:hypothetical protein
MSKTSCYFIMILILVVTIPGLSQTRAGKLGIGVDASMQYMLGAGNTNSSPAFGGGINFSYSALENFGIRGKFCFSPLLWKGDDGISYSTNIMSLNLYTGLDLMPNSTFNIFPFIGGGIAVFNPRDSRGRQVFKDGIPQPNFDYHIIPGLSLDWFFNELWSASLMGEYVLTNSQYYAGRVDNNSTKDSFMRVSLQIRYYFFDPAFISKMLDAQRDRSKRSK